MKEEVTEWVVGKELKDAHPMEDVAGRYSGPVPILILHTPPAANTRHQTHAVVHHDGYHSVRGREAGCIMT